MKGDALAPVLPPPPQYAEWYPHPYEWVEAFGRDSLLTEREKTHGNFAINAAISQQLKDVFIAHGHRKLCPVHAEALDMIALKISRILSGQARYKDHWDDIAGYAKLASETCK